MSKEAKKSSGNHLGYKYKELSKCNWELTSPSGFCTTIQVPNEDVIKAHIEMLDAETKPKLTRRR